MINNQNIFIEYQKDGNLLKVTNNSNFESIRVWFTDVDKNYVNYVDNKVKKGAFAGINFKNYDKIRIYIGCDVLNIFVYDVFFVDNEVVINKINKFTQDSFNYNILYITGHAGGGTSVVTKALRLFDFYFGKDCGLFSNRKTHESIIMRMWIRSFDNNTPIFKIKNGLKEVVNIYEFDKNNLNVIKDVNISDKVSVLSEIFPNIKFLSVIRRQNGYKSTSEGHDFHDKSEFEIYKEQHIELEGFPIFHLNFDKFFTDYTYFNKVLNYLGTTTRLKNQNDLEEIKKIIKFESKVLE